LLTRIRFWIDTLPPNKTDVLPFIDGSRAVPPKYARAIIFEGGKSEPDSQEYMIGPLPLTNTSTIQKLDYLYNGGRGGSVPYNARYFDGPRTSATDPLVASIMMNISDITAALFQGGVYYGSSDKRSEYIRGSATVDVLNSC
jgi:primary-amine oxidase